MRGFESLENKKRNLPNDIMLNGDIMKCGVELPDAKKCSCQALICDGQQSCQHTTGIMQDWRYAIHCELTKPWNEINKEAATMGGPEDDCTCMAKAVFA